MYVQKETCFEIALRYTEVELFLLHSCDANKAELVHESVFFIHLFKILADIFLQIMKSSEQLQINNTK